MSNLTANKTNWSFLSEREPSRMGIAIKDATQVYGGSYLCAGTREHATSGNRGFALPWTPAAGLAPLGFSSEKVLGATATLAECTVERIAGTIARKATVTGATVRGDFMRPVYMSDDNTLTFTRGTINTPVGFVVYWWSSTTCDVYFYSLAELTLVAIAGHARGVFHVLVSAIVAGSGNQMTGLVMPHHGRVIAVNGYIVQALVGAGASFSLNLEFGGTNMVGGVTAYLLADTVGQKNAGTTVTDDGANVFHEGDLLDIESVMTTASTAGLILLEIHYVREPGL